MLKLRTVQTFIEKLSVLSGLHAELLPSSDPALAPLAELLENFYKVNGQAYLNSKSHQIIDERLTLTSRSSTIVVRDSRHRILSTVRMSPFPFEACELVAGSIEVDAYRNYLELSRLVSWSTEEYRTLPTQMALATALCVAQTTLRSEGFVALSKTPQRRVFARFGLAPCHDAPLSLPTRAATDYWFLQADFEQIIAKACRQIGLIQESDPLFTAEETSLL